MVGFHPAFSRHVRAEARHLAKKKKLDSPAGRASQQKVLREILIRLLARALPQSSSRLFEQFQKIIHLTPAEYRREINGTAK